ncbi:RNA-binding protein [Dysgonomonas sp. GY617]|uniref:RNA-binding protein n=1 Tax=Dysgonomonas sp. GY617 TaxID=2780420 RepID=UPI001883FC4A|nr:RNA-binding protein [Dysgonomonas sp. GY617]MBF0575545.1 RNA-binding protein [Dysgonomonas sp. GY617]
MELTIKDRLYIPAFLPKEGNFKNFNLKKEILKKIEISDTERDIVGLKENQETKRIEWNTDKDIPLLVEFTSEEMEYLKQSCEKISEEQLPDDMWSSVEKVYNLMQE